MQKRLFTAQRLALRANKSRVKGARQRWIGRPLDEGAAIWKDRNGVRSAAKTQQQGVGSQVLDVGVARQRLLENREVEGAVMLMDLD